MSRVALGNGHSRYHGDSGFVHCTLCPAGGVLGGMGCRGTRRRGPSGRNPLVDFLQEALRMGTSPVLADSPRGGDWSVVLRALLHVAMGRRLRAHPFRPCPSRAVDQTLQAIQLPSPYGAFNCHRSGGAPDPRLAGWGSILGGMPQPNRRSLCVNPFGGHRSRPS